MECQLLQETISLSEYSKYVKTFFLFFLLELFKAVSVSTSFHLLGGGSGIFDSQTFLLVGVEPGAAVAKSNPCK